MAHRILGLHHVTATVDEAQPDVDFCVAALGLRLVKKTVNFDNHYVYHFYYGDERGTPGTIWTTFPYHGRGVRVGTKGAGQIAVTSFSVPPSSLEFWRERLTALGMTAGQVERPFDNQTLVVTDPSGLAIELVEASDRRESWIGGGIPAGCAIRGLHSVTLLVRSPERTVQLLTEVLGWRVAEETKGRIRLSVNGDDPGKLIDVVYEPDAPAAVNGLGTVHHVALAIGSAEEQVRAREELLALGYKVTDVLDRQYFQSIYFREPGGVLLEIATVQPGFTVDEPLDALGRALKLPPWEEPNRREIEQGLATVTY
jgi:glyoxalase family protein